MTLQEGGGAGSEGPPVGHRAQGPETGGQERPHSLEGVHPKGHPHPRAVRQEGGQSGFLKESEDQDFVPGRKQETEAQRRQELRAAGVLSGRSFMVDVGGGTSMGRGSLPPDTNSGKGLFWWPQGGSPKAI